tara:strand:- start:42 stop:344 length:303 start_codon:yes stop_codon:yes gene_type:complete
MSEEMYGDEKQNPIQPKPKIKRKTKPKKTKIEGYHLRIGVMGMAIDIMSPIPRDRFCDEMVETITTQGANPNWSGIYHLKKTDGKIVSVRLRSIDVVEEM